jgi:hypothetical protein
MAYNAQVYKNRIMHFGIKKEQFQMDGLIVGGNSGGRFYNNFIYKGNGVGIHSSSQTGNSYFYNNIIDGTKLHGIYIKHDTELYPISVLQQIYFVNNTILNTELMPVRCDIAIPNIYFCNNLVFFNDPIHWLMTKNWVVKIDGTKIIDYKRLDADLNFKEIKESEVLSPLSTEFLDNYTLKNPAYIDSGTDLSFIGMEPDMLGTIRPINRRYDLGALEKR